MLSGRFGVVLSGILSVLLSTFFGSPLGVGIESEASCFVGIPFSTVLFVEWSFCFELGSVRVADTFASFGGRVTIPSRIYTGCPMNPLLNSVH